MNDNAINHRWAVWMADTVLEKFDSLWNKWSYDYGVLCKGLEKVYELDGGEKYFEYIKNLMDSFVDDDGSIRCYDRFQYNLDFINNGKTLLFLYKKTGDKKYASAAHILRDQLKSHPRISEGGFWHKKIYPHQMWLDGLYMAEPFYAEYINLFEENKSYDDVLLQFRLIDKHSRDEKTGLFYHGYDESRESFWADKTTGLSANFWGRSVGWYACALVDTLDHINNEKDRAVLISMVSELAKAVTAVQSKDKGVWYQVLDKAESVGNFPESSCSCMFVYFLLKSIRLGYIDRSYLTCAKKGFYGIIREFIEVNERKLLDLKNTVFVSGLGGNAFRDGSYEYYISEPKQTNSLLGIGAFLMASSEFEISANKL